MSEDRDNVEAKSDDQRISIGRIPLKQVRVTKKPTGQNPMNLLVPYLDLFARLNDEELARLAGVAQEVVADLRAQVVTIDEALGPYADLLPRLTDQELVRLTGATPKTVRFWRLCQPRGRSPVPEDESKTQGIVARRAAAKATTGPVPSPEVGTAPLSTTLREDEPNAVDAPAARREEPVKPVAVAAAAAASKERGSRRPESQQAVSRLMTFAGDPFPGFDESAAGFEGVPSSDEVDVALQDLEEQT